MNKNDDQEPARTAPPGWSLQSYSGSFSGHAGPFWFRNEGTRSGVGFFSEPRHANIAGVIHGGMLMTLADMSLWDICRRQVGVFRGVTVTMNAEFLAPGPVGAFIEAEGEILRAGYKMMFARGVVRAGDTLLLSFSGSLKRAG